MQVIYVGSYPGPPRGVGQGGPQPTRSFNFNEFKRGNEKHPSEQVLHFPINVILEKWVQY